MNNISRQAGETQVFALQKLRHLSSLLSKIKFTVLLYVSLDKQLVSYPHYRDVSWDQMYKEMLYSTLKL